YAHISLAKDAEMASEAWTARGVGNERSGLRQSLQKATSCRLPPDSLGGRTDNHADTWVDLATLEYLRGRLQILQSPVRTRAEKDLIHSNIPPLDLAGRMNVAGIVRAGHERLEGG